VALRSQGATVGLSSEWLFPNEAGKPLHIANVRDRAWRSALRRAELRYRSLYQTRHTFVTCRSEALSGERDSFVTIKGRGATDAP
jgi:integrase